MHWKKPFEIYIEVTLLSLCKTNVKISGEISQAFMKYGFLTALCYALSSILSECKYGKTKEQHVHLCDMLQINNISRQAKLKVMTT